MKILKLIILLEPGISLAELANVFGDYVIKGRVCKFAEFTFSSVSMLSVKALRPIHDLLKTYEATEPLTFKGFYLHDASNNSYSPMAIHCYDGEWYTVVASTGAELNRSKNLFSLF